MQDEYDIEYLHPKRNPYVRKLRGLRFSQGLGKLMLIPENKGVVTMPVLSTFYGIIVRMYKESGGRHNMPHIHAEYSGQELVMALDGSVIEGTFPRGKQKLLEAWVEIHREELEANWTLLSNGEQFFRIDPLK